MSLLLEINLQHWQNLKRYLKAHELAIVDESKQPVLPVGVGKRNIDGIPGPEMSPRTLMSHQ